MIKTAKTDIGRATCEAGRRGFVARLVLITAVLLPMAATAQSPEASRHDVHSVGPLWSDGEWLYMARTTVSSVTPPAGEGAGISTQIYRRALSNTFKEFGKPIPRRLLAMTPLGDNLAVLTDDGNWLTQSADGAIIGLPLALPEARLMDLASDRDGLYAIAKVRGGVARLVNSAHSSPDTLPATQPATGSAVGVATLPVEPLEPVNLRPTTGRSASAPSPTQPATAASTRPQQNVPDMLAVVFYAGGSWQPVGDIPFDVARPIDPVSLLVYNSTPFLLVREAPGLIRLWRLDGVKWSEVGQAKIPEKTRVARLIPGGVKPTVWLSPAMEAIGEPDQVLVFDAAGLGPARTLAQTTTAPATASVSTRPATRSASGLANEMSLSATKGISPNQRSAAFAFNYFRSITFKENAMSEQAYDAVSFAPVGSPRAQPFEPPGLPYFDIARYGLVAVAMGFAIMASLRRRAELADLEIDPDALPLASMLPRLMAGVIDGAPLIAAFLFVFMHYGPDDDGGETAEARIAISIGIVAYVLITMLTEVFAGRSFGKMLFGLRVISVTGRPATRGQLAIRNLLRVIDVLLTLFPLLLIPFSPLRQRAGDAAAGTIVVTTHPARELEEDDSSEG